MKQLACRSKIGGQPREIDLSEKSSKIVQRSWPAAKFAILSMSRKYIHTIYTRQLSRQQCNDCLAELISVLKSRQVIEIEMMFG